MDHADFHMISMQLSQTILKSSPYFFDLPRALILTVDPHGTQMSLNNKLIPPSFQGFAEVMTEVGIRRIQIKIIDSRLRCRIHPSIGVPAFFFRKSFSAQTDLSDFQACAA